MKISNVSVALSSTDIISIIDEFVHVKGLSINEIKMQDCIHIVGEYKTIFRIEFSIKVNFRSVEDNKISLDILKIGLGKISIWPVIRRQALKMVVKALKEQGIGIDVSKDILVLDVDRLLKDIPVKLGFDIQSLTLEDEKIHAHIGDIDFSLIKEEEAHEEASEDETQEEESSEQEEVPITKVNDGYTKIRDNIKVKVPCKYKNIMDYAAIVPDFLILMYRLFKDNRVEVKTKILVASSLAYLSFPIDIIPDKIPFIGKIDDIAIIFFTLNKIVNDIPENIVIENWQGDDNIIEIIGQGLQYANDALGGDTIDTIIDKVENFI